MKKITQKQLIDYCNNAPLGHCYICPYESKECEIYCTKYGATPATENFFNSERYTDEEILINKNTVLSNFCPNCGADMRGE